MQSLIILSIVFFVVSFVFSMIGLGGGILYVPILLFAGYTMEQAPGISLILIIATSSAAFFTFWKNKKVDWKLALLIDPPTNIMAFVGGYFSATVSESFLRWLLVAVLITAGILMLKNRKNALLPHVHAEKPWYWHRNFDDQHYSVNIPLVLSATAILGLFSGMLGITGSIIKVPLMVLLCGVPMDIAIATSTVMVIATALSAITGHAIQGNVSWQIGAIMAMSTILGGFLGSKLSLKTNKRKLKKIFGIVVLLVAVQLVYRLLIK
ncbi:MAG: sulfite exporter TauE/SafE family protein [Kiritimatiellae bacterium]|nr:sulfite exporter TauE/SafE family protein [Kiritimatiellia bacterium]